MVRHFLNTSLGTRRSLRALCGNALVCAIVLTTLAGCATARRETQSNPLLHRMATVPAGIAIFGNAGDRPFEQRDEGPRRTISITAPFEIGRFEVTHAQYEAFVHANDYHVAGPCLTDRTRRGNWVMDANTNHRDPGFQQGDNHPVACVSYEDVLAYIGWLNAQTGQNFRLPTELEWEYAASAGAATLYPWGDDPAGACASANGFDVAARRTYVDKVDTSAYKTYDPLPCDDGSLFTHPVGSLKPNGLGVHDMIGNVGEWVADCYMPSHENLAADGMAIAPDGPCRKRVAKGGSWGTLAHNLRTAERFPYPPAHRDDSIGFRLARSVVPMRIEPLDVPRK